jgi:hypothetical protein
MIANGIIANFNEFVVIALGCEQLIWADRIFRSG